MTNEQLQERLYEATLRIEKCIPLFGALHCDSANTDLREFVDEVEYKAVVALWPEFGKWLKDNSFEPEELIQLLLESGKMGWLIQVATPVMSLYGDGDSASYSWGHYYTHWIYADTMDEALAQADAAREIARRVLQAADAVSAGVPDGFVLVPREPTPEMLEARAPSKMAGSRRAVWAAMLSAAPGEQKGGGFWQRGGTASKGPSATPRKALAIRRCLPDGDRSAMPPGAHQADPMANANLHQLVEVLAAQGRV